MPTIQASNEQLTRKQIIAGLRAFKRGDFSVRLPDDLSGIDGQICEAFNDLVVQASTLSDEVAQLGTEVGKEGHTRRRMRRSGARGGWAVYVTFVNELMDDLTAHMSEIATVVAAVAHGGLSQSIDIEGSDEPVRGTFLRYARTVNDMVMRPTDFSSEVTRVAREVGTDGVLGGQAEVAGVSGVWRELTDNVNSMANNLTLQVRAIGDVATAVTKGDLTQTIDVEARGEVAVLKDNINQMIQTLLRQARGQDRPRGALLRDEGRIADWVILMDERPRAHAGV